MVLYLEGLEMTLFFGILSVTPRRFFLGAKHVLNLSKPIKEGLTIDISKWASVGEASARPNLAH